MSGITCPGYKCNYFVDQGLVSAIVDKNLYQKYIHFSAKEFIERNASIKWCPAPGCELAVLNPKAERTLDWFKYKKQKKKSTRDKYKRKMSFDIEWQTISCQLLSCVVVGLCGVLIANMRFTGLPHVKSSNGGKSNACRTLDLLLSIRSLNAWWSLKIVFFVWLEESVLLMMSQKQWSGYWSSHKIVHFVKVQLKKMVLSSNMKIHHSFTSSRKRNEHFFVTLC